MSSWKDNGRKPSVMDACTHGQTHSRTLIHVNIRTEGQGKSILPCSGAEAGHKQVFANQMSWEGGGGQNLAWWWKQGLKNTVKSPKINVAIHISRALDLAESPIKLLVAKLFLPINSHHEWSPWSMWTGQCQWWKYESRWIITINHSFLLTSFDLNFAAPGFKITLPHRWHFISVLLAPSSVTKSGLEAMFNEKLQLEAPAWAKLDWSDLPGLPCRGVVYLCFSSLSHH